MKTTGKIALLLLSLLMSAKPAEPLKYSELITVKGYWKEIGYIYDGQDTMSPALQTFMLEIQKNKMIVHVLNDWDLSYCFVNKIKIAKSKKDEIILIKGMLARMTILTGEKWIDYIEIEKVNDTLIVLKNGGKYPDFPVPRVKTRYYYKKLKEKPVWWPKKIRKGARVSG
jgi:hypothetical protein